MAQNNKRNYTQSFTYDKIGNMLTKVSTESKYPNVSVSALNYTNAYSYYTDAPHRAEIIGDMYYKYDNNGNVIEERQGGHREETVGGTFSYTYPDTDITRASQAFGWDRGGETEPDSTYRREYTWDEENRLTGTSDPSYTTVYTYDHEGERTIKYSDLGETLYFDSMWLEADTEGTGRLRCTKNIYIGETRIASKLNYKGEGTDYEDIHTYYYHTDHLSSSNVVTDADGEVYEHMEYTPYGEKWILDQNDNSKYDMIPYRFTAKEWDEETGLYYMSARYLNPETSRWVSSDPTGWGLVNPMDGDFNLRSRFSIVESMNPYSYCSNNPINYFDPTGLDEAYFLYTYKNTDYDQKLKSQERSSIDDDVQRLELHGSSTTVSESTSKSDIIRAFEDDEAELIVLSGHGYSGDSGVQTSDKKAFSPEDLADVDIGENLTTVIFENCHQGDIKEQWQKVLGDDVEIVSWEGTMTTGETRRFNSNGLFDRQDNSLADYVSRVIDNNVDAVTGAAPVTGGG